MLKIFRRKNKGQSAIEYAALLIIVIGSFIAAENYIKRGLQGRWKATVDDLGDQYDPRTAATAIRHTIVSNVQTQIVTLNALGGFFTSRQDMTNSTERKIGSRTIGAY